jgi:hypothetical protein
MLPASWMTFAVVMLGTIAVVVHGCPALGVPSLFASAEVGHRMIVVGVPLA